MTEFFPLPQEVGSRLQCSLCPSVATHFTVRKALVGELSAVCRRHGPAEETSTRETPQLDQELFTALAEVGRIIEEIPHDERRAAVDKFLREQSIDLDGFTRDFFVGLFIIAHDHRLSYEAWAETVDGARTVTEWGVTNGSREHGSAPDVLPCSSRKDAEGVLERRRGYHRDWHEGAGYGKDEYADPGVVMKRTVTTTPWREASND